MIERKPRGFGILSGGLDSILAVKVLQEQELDLMGILFATPFFGPRPGVDLGRLTGIPVRVVDISEKHLEMLKSPKYGYGSQMNPCIDCHALMLREAGRMMELEGGDFLFTGEVLGQRPMSQRRDALRSVEKLAGYPGRVLRPLSAKLLPPTLVEEEGLVERDRLQDIQGRSRKRQMELADRYGITEYAQPAGGCMLTSEGFVRKLRELFRHYPNASVREIEIIKWGRQFLLPGGSLCIVGRQQTENKQLENLARAEDYVLRTLNYPSPIGVLMEAQGAEEDLPLAAELVASYSDAPLSDPGRDVDLECRNRGRVKILKQRNLGKEKFKEYLI